MTQLVLISVTYSLIIAKDCTLFTIQAKLINMLSIAHATTGALIAVKITNPYLSIPLILASHYILDAIPHWDAGTGLSNGTRTPKQAFLAEIPDILIAGLLIIFFFQNGKPLDLGTLSGSAPYWGGFLGLLPDFLEAPRNFLRYEPKFLKPFNQFHHSVHHSTPNKLKGLTPQIILLYLVYMYR